MYCKISNSCAVLHVTFSHTWNLNILQKGLFVQCFEEILTVKYIKARKPNFQIFSNCVWFKLCINAYTYADQGGVTGARPSPYGTKFFHFRIHFHRKVPASEVDSHQRVGAQNPGSATD